MVDPFQYFAYVVYIIYICLYSMVYIYIQYYPVIFLGIISQANVRIVYIRDFRLYYQVKWGIFHKP